MNLLTRLIQLANFNSVKFFSNQKEKNTMNNEAFQILSRYLCKHYGYHRLGGYDAPTGLAWACRKNQSGMFHIFVETCQPAYEQMYQQVTRFQEGYAVVKGNSGYFSHHIQPNGLPAYDQRFMSVGLFFEGLADASDSGGEFHISPSGVPAYGRRFKRVGHFCQGLAQAQDDTGHFHIKPDGTPAYKWRGLRNSPFNQQSLAWSEIRENIGDKKRIIRVLINQQGEIVSKI